MSNEHDATHFELGLKLLNNKFHFISIGKNQFIHSGNYWFNNIIKNNLNVNTREKT